MSTRSSGEASGGLGAIVAERSTIRIALYSLHLTTCALPTRASRQVLTEVETVTSRQLAFDSSGSLRLGKGFGLHLVEDLELRDFHFLERLAFALDFDL